MVNVFFWEEGVGAYILFLHASLRWLDEEQMNVLKPPRSIQYCKGWKTFTNEHVERL
jgi:hypothetical protein